jgi:cytochrome b pre-mRNA-processing protein 3
MQRVILRLSHRILIRHISHAPRSYTSASSPKPIPGPTKPYKHEKAPSPEQIWLTRKLKQSPTAMRVFLKISGALEYGSSRQVAARRALALYQQLCASREEEDRQFWAKGTPPSPPLFSLNKGTNKHSFSGTKKNVISFQRSSPGLQ